MTTDPIAPGGVLLHIGPPKTGTTAIQAVGFRNRPQWLEAGVRYPGTTFNHRVAVSALMGRTTGWGSGEKLPALGAWKKLQAEIDADPDRRVLVSSEFVSECDDAQAKRFADALGDRLHIAVTVRGYAATLTSSWQELVKVGSRHPFETWLRGVLADPPDPSMSPTFQRRSDLGLVVGRWVSLLGPDRVTVVVGDKARPTQLLDAFADLLGLPYELMRVREQEGTLRNRSLSLPEAEMIRAMNVIVRSHEGASSSTYYDTLVRGGAVARMQHVRRPGPEEPRVLLPEWAAGRAAARARAYVAAVETTKCRVLGDLAAVLCAPVPTCSELPAVHYVPVEAAAEALAGVFSGAMGQRAFFGLDLAQVEGGTSGGGVVPPPTVSRREQLRKAYRSTAELPTSTLLAVAAARQVLHAKTRLRRDARLAKVLARVRGR